MGSSRDVHQRPPVGIGSEEPVQKCLETSKLRTATTEPVPTYWARTRRGTLPDPVDALAGRLAVFSDSKKGIGIAEINRGTKTRKVVRAARTLLLSIIIEYQHLLIASMAAELTSFAPQPRSLKVM